MLERLARSFGGDASDAFILARTPAIHRRVAQEYFPQTPRRGFDALVEVLASRPELVPELFDSDDLAASAIARLLGASPEDRVVRSVLVRLRAVVARPRPQ